MSAIKYRPEVDGLRAVAVLPVIFYHAQFPGFSGGYLGVDTFFVISGYLITSIIATEIAQGRFSILKFYERRARRILPALVTVCAVSAVIAWQVMLPEHLVEFGQSIEATMLFVSNWFFYLHSGYFAIEADLTPLLHTWSLAIEEQYYIFFPLLLLGISVFARRRYLLFLVPLALASLLAAQWTVSENRELAFFALYTRAWELFFGAFVALTLHRISDVPIRFRKPAAWLGLIALIASMAFFKESTEHPGLLTVIPVAGTALILAFADQQNRVGRLLSLKPLIGIGLISYSLYLVHQPLFAFYRLLHPDGVSPGEYAVLIALSIGLAYAMWRWIETPFRQRTVFPAKAIAAWSVAGMALMIGVGAVYANSIGFPARIAPEARAILAEMHTSKKARAQGIHVGVCHFGASSGDFESFNRDWNCLEREHASLLTYGDSLSADKAWALRTAGVRVANIGGANCPLMPVEGMPHCTVIMERIVEMARRGEVTGIILANRFEKHRISPAHLKKIAEYWSKVDVPVLLFTPMPEFTMIAEKIGRAGLLGRPLNKIEVERDFGAKTEAVQQAMRGSNITVINTRDLFCGGPRGECTPFINGHPLVIDYAHLSPNGAELLGARTVASPVWQAWLAKTKAAKIGATTDVGTTSSIGRP